MKKQYIIPTSRIHAVEADSLIAESEIENIQIHDRESDGEILVKESQSGIPWEEWENW